MAYCSVRWSKTGNLIILLLIVDQALSTNKNAGCKNKNGNGSGSGITFNPNNPFLKNPVKNANYQENPFLNPSPSLRFHLPQTGNNNGVAKPLTPGKDNGLINSVLSGNSNTENNKREIANYSHNPFLMSNLGISNKNNNTTSPDTQKHKNEEKASISTVSSHVMDKINSSTVSSISKPISPNTEKKKEKEKSSNAPQKQQNPAGPVSSIIEDFPTRENTRTKSDLKCEEYSRQILKTTETISLVGTNTQVIKVANDKCTTPDRLITGGTVATPGEFPHMVALGNIINGPFVYECGGTLISPLWVLTAAHCTHGPDGGPSVVKVGLHNLKDNEPGSIISIERSVRHPSYKFPAMYADIALIKLQHPVTFNDFIKPACLYQLYDNVPMTAWVSGWGVTELAGEQSEKLQKAQLDIIDNIACSIRHNKSISVPYGVTPSMICAGDPQGGWNKDTCQGDSGGPLQVPHPKHLCLFQVIGITSFGEGCAIVNTPGVYTRVSHYLNWIEDIVWPDE